MEVINFTPLSAALGGGLIGLAAVILMASVGRIAGISNITYALLDGLRLGRVHGWRLTFVLGMVLGATAWHVMADAPVTPQRQMHPGWLVLAGLLVGYGTAMGRGCTSGHGVCGLSRLSSRSLVAVAVFMVVAGVTVYVVRHFLA